MDRRQFLQLAGAGLFQGVFGKQLPIFQPDDPNDPDFDWYSDPPVVLDMRTALEEMIGDQKMALDFRCINHRQDELFRIQINAYDLFPVASCFKSMLVLYYFLNIPEDEWDVSQVTPLYRMAVYSDNVATGTVIDNVGRRVEGPGNVIEKFNDFLRVRVGLINGLHTWNWEGSPTQGLSDERYAPSINSGRVVWSGDRYYQVDNVFNVADLSRCYDFIVRGEYFTQSDYFREAARATKELLSIPADSGYQSPIERVFPAGYMGKDGILPGSDLEIGRVVNDAGAISINNHTYIIAFMSAGESETVAINTLGEVINQMNIYEETSGDSW